MNSKTPTGLQGELAGPPAPRTRRSWLWRFGRFCLLGSATLATLWVLYHLEENWRGKRAWQQYRAAMEAQGAVFELAKLVPPPVPDEQNFAMTPLLKPLCDFHPPGTTGAGPWRDEEGKNHAQAIREEDPELDARIEGGHGSEGRPLEPAVTEPTPAPVEPLVTRPGRPNWKLGETIRLEEWQAYYQASEVFPSPPEPRAPAEDVLQALTRYEAELAELAAAAQRPYARFNLNYEEENPFNILLPHLGALRNIARVLQLRAVARLEAGQAQAALEDVHLMLRLADSIKEEPVLISHLVRLALWEASHQTVWEGLHRQSWSEPQLAQLQGELAGADLVAELKSAFMGERAFGTAGIELMIRSPQTALQIANSGSDAGPAANAVRLVPKGWFYFEAVNYNRYFDQFLLETLPDTAAELDVTRIKRAGEAFEQDLSTLSPLKAVFGHRIFTRQMIPALNKVPGKSIQAEVFRTLAVTATALERHRLAQGSYPESLDALTPSWLAAVPKDLITHEPLRYERAVEESFRLWSVGWNEKDDGGEVVVTRSSDRDIPVAEEGDWVWPQLGGMPVRVRDEGAR